MNHLCSDNLKQIYGWHFTYQCTICHAKHRLIITKLDRYRPSAINYYFKYKLRDLFRFIKNYETLYNSFRF